MNIIEAIGRIDYGYWILNQLNEQLDYQTPVEKMINVATGFDKETLICAISAVKDIVKCKKIAGYDNSVDKKYLAQLRKLLKIK